MSVVYNYVLNYLLLLLLLFLAFQKFGNNYRQLFPSTISLCSFFFFFPHLETGSMVRGGFLLPHPQPTA